jgi:hypothetical protein
MRYFLAMTYGWLKTYSLVLLAVAVQLGCSASDGASIQADAGGRGTRGSSNDDNSGPDRVLPGDEQPDDEPEDTGRVVPSTDAGGADAGDDPSVLDGGSPPPRDVSSVDVQSVESDAPYSERPIGLPASGFTQVPGSLFETDWAWNAPRAACADGFESIKRYADVYRVTTTSSAPISAEFRLVTALQNDFVSLADGEIHVLSAGGPWADGSTCLGTGVLTAASQSAVSGIQVSASAPVWVVVTSAGGGVEGSYDLLVGLTTATESTDPNCSDSCIYAGNGTCQDGGRGSSGSQCTLGTDCSDCDVRDPDDPGTGGGIEVCNDSCGIFAGDGLCDDGGPSGDGFGFCDPGTDCTDCGPRLVSGCTNTCFFAGDLDCDDGRPGADTDLCPLGSDCADCGPL